MTRQHLLALAAMFATLAADKPNPPTEAPDRMTVPEGFRVSLFAGEPDVVQPIAMTFDDRGRLWVVECRSYPQWKSDGTGSDRVVILEDTDGDGRHDKRTVFLDNGSNLSGIEFGFGGIWLCSIPNLLFIPDRNGDDRPDGPPEVVLDGWSLKCRHNVFNSLGWGPDGWLYGCNGIIDTSHVGPPGTPEQQRVAINCGVWRYHPTRKVVEAYAHGTTNPFGLDWDDYGRLFITNCVIEHIWHVVPGAHFKRMYGQDLNPYTYELMQTCADHLHWAGGHWTSSRTTGESGGKVEHSDAGGGHAHAGCAVYLGENFPAEYRNSVFMCNIHGNRLNRDQIVTENGRVVAKHAPDFLFANDPWFRGLCVKLGPEGGLYVSDWTDTGECHNYEVADITNGRVYRVVSGSPKPWTDDLTKKSDAELLALVTSRNEWASRHARRLLQERAAAGKLTWPATGPNGDDAAASLRLLWTKQITGMLTEKDLLAHLGSPHPEVRAWAVRIAAEWGSPDQPLIELARTESSVEVRTELAAALQKMSPEKALQLASVLLDRPTDDPNLALMIWYGVSPVVQSHPDDALKVALAGKLGQVREFSVRLYLTRPEVNLHTALDTVSATLPALDDAARQDVLVGIRSAIAGRRDLKPPRRWDEISAKLLASADPAVRAATEALAVQFGDAAIIARLQKRTTDASAATETRRAAIDLLVARKLPALGATLRECLADPAVRAAALRGLASYPDPETPTAILKAYPSLTVAEKADAIQTLATRPAFALSLLAAIEAGTVPKSDLTAFTARQILALSDAKVSAKLESVWGTVRPASATRVAQAKKFKTLLTRDTVAKADRTRGRALFTQHCAACHKLFGDGGDVGPELTGSQRANLDYILENVLDPSAVVSREFLMTTFALADGRVVTGLVKRETPDAVFVRTVNEEIVIPVDDIDDRKPTRLSIMPDGLFDTLKDQEIRDLIGYLAGKEQVSLPPVQESVRDRE